MNKLLKISKDVSLPLDVVTQTIAILAKRRVGKSYTARKLTEELLRCGQQIVSVDPKGDQWGIRSSADGKKPGYPIVILGGEHGDAPLEVNSGEVVAKLVVEERVSVLLDLSMFRKHEVATFMAIFLETLYRLKAQEKHRTPVMVVFDEADAIAPQKPQRGEERMLGAIDDIVRRGGQRGIGCALITQRSAVINKNVLTQIQMLIVLRTIAPQDLAAMKAWIDVHGTIEQGKALMDSLPSLPIGDAWFWSPGWPTAEGIFKRTHILPITTFDSAATPKPGESRIVPKNLADVDLDALKKQMAATIEKARSENPATLKKRIAELERDLKNAPVQTKEVVRSDVKAIEKAVREAVAGRDREWRSYTEDLEKAITKIATVITSVELNMVAPKPKPMVFKDTVAYGADMAAPGKDKTVRIVADRKSDGSTEIVSVDELFQVTGSHQKVLDATAWINKLGIEHPTKIAVAFIAGYSPSSSGYTNLMGALRSAGLVSYPGPGLVSLTPAGEAKANRPDFADHGELREKVMQKLMPSERKILQPLLDVYPAEMSSEELAEKSGYSATSSGFTNLRGKLRSIGLLDYPRAGQVKAADILFK